MKKRNHQIVKPWIWIQILENDWGLFCEFLNEIDSVKNTYVLCVGIPEEELEGRISGKKNLCFFACSVAVT